MNVPPAGQEPFLLRGDCSLLPALWSQGSRLGRPLASSPWGWLLRAPWAASHSRGWCPGGGAELPRPGW